MERADHSERNREGSVLNSKLTIIGGALSILIVITLSALLYASYQNNQSLKNKLDTAELEIKGYKAAAEEQRRKIQSYNELGAKHTKELSDAKREIEDLNNSLRNGDSGVFVNASCPALSETDRARGEGYASSPRLGEPAREDYIRLRKMMIENQKQTLYLQDYIREQCLGE